MINVRVATKYSGAEVAFTSGTDTPFAKLIRRAAVFDKKLHKKLMPELGRFTVRMVKLAAPKAQFYNDNVRKPGTLIDGIDHITSTLGFAITSVAIDPYSKVDYAAVTEFGGQSRLGTTKGIYTITVDKQPYFYDTIDDIAIQFVKAMPKIYADYIKKGKIQLLSQYFNKGKIVQKIKARNARRTAHNKAKAEGYDESDEAYLASQGDSLPTENLAGKGGYLADIDRPAYNRAHGIETVQGVDLAVGRPPKLYRDAQKPRTPTGPPGRVKRVTKAEKITKAAQRKSKAAANQKILNKPESGLEALKRKGARERNRQEQRRKKITSRPSRRTNETSKDFARRLNNFYNK